MLCQVGDGAGFGNCGWSDAISMQTWPSKKLTITGYEVKATRQDWQRELDSPDKNATWQEQCHEWYVVAPKSIVQIEELPDRWGLMIPVGEDGLRIAKRAEIRENDSVPLDLMAAVFRAAANEHRRLQGESRVEIYNEARKQIGKELQGAKKSAMEWEDRYRQIASVLSAGWESDDKLKARAKALTEMERTGEPLLRRLIAIKDGFKLAADKLSELEKELTKGNT